MTTGRAEDPMQIAPHVVLIFPPVWVPIAPHLAISTLTAYLRQQGVRVTSIDANIEFFSEYLLSSDSLHRMLSKGQEILKGREASNSEIPAAWKRMLAEELSAWEKSAAVVGDLLSVIREKERFLNPELILPTMDRILGLLRLCSIAHWPERISLSNYYREDVQILHNLLELCEDPERNVFLPFFHEKILPEVRRAEPMAVGISISSGQQFFAAMTLARLLRKRLPHIHVVVGGQRLFDVEEKVLKVPFTYKNFFHSAVKFEGELPLELLLRALHEKKPLQGIPNLMFLDGETVRAGERAEPVPLEDLPHAAYEDTPWEKYLMPVRYAPVRMAEGCYWGKCTFCGRNGPREAVFNPPERVLDELQFLMDVHGIKDFSVNDDCLPPSYWNDIVEGILKRRLHLSMFIWAKPVKGFTADLLAKMARAGVRGIRWGLESANPRILKLMRKGTTVDTAASVLRDAHGAGIWNHTCLILGFPTERRAEAESTLEFIQSNRAIIQSFMLYPFELIKKSYIFQHPEEFGVHDIRLEARPLRDQVSFKTHLGMSSEETRTLVPQAKRRLLSESYGWPFWYFLKMREYLQLYLDHYGLEGVLKIPFTSEGLRRLS